MEKFKTQRPVKFPDDFYREKENKPSSRDYFRASLIIVGIMVYCAGVIYASCWGFSKILEGLGV